MRGQNQTPLVAIVGATATGKTSLSVALAQKLDGEIINADAMQFYRGMDIGTAKAPVHERAGIRHHLIDIYELSQEATVAEFQTKARELIVDITERGKIPILVGGSGLYVRAVLDDIEFPPTDPTIRLKWEVFVQVEGIQSAQERLAQADPVSAERLKDTRRIIRALEVFELTGRPFSSFMPERKYFFPHTYQIGLKIDRDVLHDRIAQRVQTMIQAGLVEETRQLQRLGLEQAPTASQAIGYPQTLEYLAGRLSEVAWAEKIIVATRQFARRQDTWFKADPRVEWFDYSETELAQKVTEFILFE